MDCTINFWGAVELFGGVGRNPQKKLAKKVKEEEKKSGAKQRNPI